MSEKDNKTEDPTPKRLRDAKKKGQVAKSSDLNSASSLFVFTLLLGVIGNYLLKKSLEFIKSFLLIDYKININIDSAKLIFTQGAIRFFVIIIPIALVSMVLGIIINIIQVGFLFTKEPLKPDFKKLNPIQGFKNIFSKKSLFTLVKNLLKLFLVFYLSFKNLSSSVGRIINSGNVGTEKLFFYFIDFIKDLSINIAIIMFILAIVDYVFERKEHRKNLKMSKQEIIDEFKEMEGDPQVKGQRRQRQRELAMGRMMQDLETSTVVVTNPTHIAVGIRYDDKIDSSPIITAKGAGAIAEKIKEIAREKEIPIIENKPLARLLYKDIEIGNEIPEKLYQAVAEILVIVYKIQQDKKGKI